MNETKLNEDKPKARKNDKHEITNEITKTYLTQARNNGGI